MLTTILYAYCATLLSQELIYNADTSQLRLLSDSKKCIDLYGGNASDGAQLEIW